MGWSGKVISLEQQLQRKKAEKAQQAVPPPESKGQIKAMKAAESAAKSLKEGENPNSFYVHDVHCEKLLQALVDKELESEPIGVSVENMGAFEASNAKEAMAEQMHYSLKQSVEGLQGLEGLEGLEALKNLEGLEKLEGLEGLKGLSGDMGSVFDEAILRMAALTEQYTKSQSYYSSMMTSIQEEQAKAQSYYQSMMMNVIAEAMKQVYVRDKAAAEKAAAERAAAEASKESNTKEMDDAARATKKTMEMAR